MWWKDMNSSKHTFTRRSIHDRSEHQPTFDDYEEEYEDYYQEEDEDYYEEEDESEFISELQKNELYPDLKNERKQAKYALKKKELYPDLKNERKQAKYALKKKVKNEDNVSKQISSDDVNSSEKSHKESNFLKMSLILSIVILLFCTLFYFSKTQENVEIRDVLQLIEEMKNKFHNQPKWTYKILSSALKKVVDDSSEPSAPAIITVLANQDAAKTAKEFCMYLAKLVSRKYVMIDRRIYQQKDENKIKVKIDEEIRSKVESSSLNVVVVDQVEEIPLNATMIFHNYCDHDNAYFKRVVYMFVLSLEEVLDPNAEPKELDYAAIKHYRKTWQHAHPDTIESLIARLTVDVINVSLVRKETDRYLN